MERLFVVCKTKQLSPRWSSGYSSIISPNSTACRTSSVVIILLGRDIFLIEWGKKVFSAPLPWLVSVSFLMLIIPS
jgi:hypothetical protein